MMQRGMRRSPEIHKSILRVPLSEMLSCLIIPLARFLRPPVMIQLRAVLMMM